MKQVLPDNEVRALLKGLSTHDFLKIGINEIAYIRKHSVEGREKPAYGLYAADGTQLSLLDNMDMVRMTLSHHDLHAVTLH